MNRLWCSLSQTLRRCRAPAATQRLVGWCSSASRIMPAILRRPPSTVSRPLRRQFRWYHDPRKAMAATAIGLSAAVMATCDHEVVPCTNRSHLVVLSSQEERDLGESLFAEEKAKHRHKIIDPCHPDSVRVRLIAERIVHAANRGLGIYDHRDAPMLRVTRKGKKPWAPQPHTRHLHGLDGWELVLARHGNPTLGSAPGGKIIVFTELLDWFKTDGEIAFALAHEVGHLIARHQADIMSNLWLPAFLCRSFIHLKEIEADRIGTLLLGAAGFHPHYALAFLGTATAIVGDRSVREEFLEAHHPHPRRRLRLLSDGNTMEEALELYREATAMDKVTEKYFVSPSMKEIEADRIGTLLLGAAGFHPHYALAFIGKATAIVGDRSVREEILEAHHPHPKRRLRLLSDGNTMEEALELYREATAMDKVTEKYFVSPSM